MRIVHDWGSDFVVASNSTDVSYHAVRAYYHIYERLRKQHPGLLFEICNDGGRMVDFGSAAHGDYFSITDTYDPLSNRRAFYDASHLLPAAMLESYVEKWPAPRIENFRLHAAQRHDGLDLHHAGHHRSGPGTAPGRAEAIALYKGDYGR